MTIASLGEGVTAALRQSAETAFRLNKNVVLIYRRPFANLNNKSFLTHVWPVDAPFDFNMNRREVHVHEAVCEWRADPCLLHLLAP